MKLKYSRKTVKKQNFDSISKMYAEKHKLVCSKMKFHVSSKVDSEV